MLLKSYHFKKECWRKSLRKSGKILCFIDVPSHFVSHKFIVAVYDDFYLADGLPRSGTNNNYDISITLFQEKP